MKTDVPTSKQPKTGRVTLREARAAVRAVKGDRPRGKFVTVSASRLEDLRDKYLGLIVHGSSKPGSARRVVEVKRVARKAVARKTTKRK